MVLDLPVIKRTPAEPDRVLMDMVDEGDWKVLRRTDKFVLLGDSTDRENPVELLVARKAVGDGTIVVPSGKVRKSVLRRIVPSLDLNMNLKQAGPSDKEVQDSSEARNRRFRSENLVQ